MRGSNKTAIAPARAPGGLAGRAIQGSPLTITMYQRILVPLDGSATAECGLREALALAQAQRSSLYLLHALDSFPLTLGAAPDEAADRLRARLRRYGEDLLGRAAAAASEAGVPSVMLLREVATGRVADVILQEAVRIPADLVVMGTHGRRGFNKLVLGSNAQAVVHGSSVPVLLVRQRETLVPQALPPGSDP